MPGPTPESIVNQAYLANIAQQPTDPLVMQTAIWDVMSSVVYEGRGLELLPAVRPVAEALADHPSLAHTYEHHAASLNAGVLLGTWDVVSAFAVGEPVTNEIRQQSCCQLGSVVSRFTDGSFDLASTEGVD